MVATFATSALSDALVVLAAAGIVIPLFTRFRITPVIGFILVGVAVGPFGLGRHAAEFGWLDYISIADPLRLAPFAEFGIVMLLFSVGLELSLARLWSMRRAVFGLGSLELLASAALMTAVLIATGMSVPGALALGLALAMSSTALVLRITSQRTPVGRAALSMLLFEDLALVPIIFLLGAMAPGSHDETVGGAVRPIMLGLVVVAGLFAFGRVLLPRLFAQAARTKSPELFLALSLVVVIIAALATAAAGLSPILGALIAGLLIAETEYYGEVEAITAPFKGLALGVFLITVGMAIDLSAIWANLLPILGATAGVLLLKAIVTGVLLRLMGARPGTSTETGILMASPSETTLIVLTAAASARLIDAPTAEFWRTVTAIGLTVTPLLALIGRRLARRVDESGPPVDEEPGERRAIIVGFGRVGRLVADMMETHGQPYIAIDADTDLIREAKKSGYRATFGDAANAASLARLGIDTASAVILTMDEPVAAQRLVKRLRGQFPALPIIARARDPGHAAQLYRAGASHAVPETLEAALQLSEAVLVDLGVAMGPVIASIHAKRDEFRQQIMDEGELAEKPQLKSGSLRERTTEPALREMQP